MTKRLGQWQVEHQVQELEKRQEERKYTISDFINRLQKLPKNLEVKGYIFVTDDGDCKNTFTMGDVK